MKKFLSLTIIALIALIALTTSVSAADMTASEFLADIEDGKMSADVTLTESVIINKDMTLDLNGKTLTLGSYSIDLESGTLTVKNGKIVADVDALRVLSTGSAILNIEKDAEVTAGDCAVIIKFPGAVLNTAGKLTSTGGGYAAIQGNGSDGNGGIKVNITGGTITSNAEGVYFPNTTELNISGGTITGTTAVYHKSGKLNISGGTLKATGAKAEYVHNPNGCNATGDALVIEASDYPGGVPVVSITGGTFISQNNKAIGYYKQTEDYKLTNEKFITGGTFSSDVNQYIATNTVPAVKNENGDFVIPVNLNKPTNLKWDGTTAKWDAVPNATSYDLIILNENWIISKPINTKNTSFDFSEYLTDKNEEYIFVVIALSDKVDYMASEAAESEVYVFPSEGGQGTAEQEPVKDETPKTGAFDIALYVLGAIALVSVVGTVKAKKPGKYSK